MAPVEFLSGRKNLFVIKFMRSSIDVTFKSLFGALFRVNRGASVIIPSILLWIIRILFKRLLAQPPQTGHAYKIKGRKTRLYIKSEHFSLTVDFLFDTGKRVSYPSVRFV